MPLNYYALIGSLNCVKPYHSSVIFLPVSLASYTHIFSLGLTNIILASPWTHKIQQKTAVKRVTFDFIMGLNVFQ